MSALVPLNQFIAFSVEVAVLVALGRAGYRIGGGGLPGWVFAAVVVLFVAGLWFRFAAPSASARLEMPWLLVFKSLVFTVGCAALWGAAGAFWAVAFAVFAAAHLVLATALGVL